MQRTETEEERPNSDGGASQEANQQHPPHRHRRWLTVLQTMTVIVALLLAVYNHALIGLPQEETKATAWLVESEPFDPLAPCNEGGFRIHTGHDVNGNGLLDAGERQTRPCSPRFTGSLRTPRATGCPRQQRHLATHGNPNHSSRQRHLSSGWNVHANGLGHQRERRLGRDGNRE